MKNLFETKQGFAKARWKRRVPYNARRAYMKEHSFNAVTVKEPWGAIKEAAEEVPLWRNEAARLTVGGNNVRVIKNPFLLLLVRYTPH